VTNQLKMRESDPAILFASNSVNSELGGATATLTGSDGCTRCGPAATNLEGALSALASDPDAQGGPAVVITDGWQNHGDALRAVAALLTASIRLFLFTPPGATAVPNVAMLELALPSALSKSAPFALGVTMENLNSTPVTGTISIARNGAPLEQ